MISQKYSPYTLGLGHFINDCISGFILSFLSQGNIGNFILLLTTYNVLGFVFQPATGLIVDRFLNAKKWILLSLIAIGISLGIVFISPWAAVILAGIASSFFHVAGGAMIQDIKEDTHVFHLGVFTAPGVFGLTLGTVLGHINQFPFFLILLTIIALFLLLFSKEQATVRHLPIQLPTSTITVSLILLILGIGTRSAVWVMFQPFVWNEPMFFLTCAFAAALGKLFGGILGEVILEKNAVGILLLLSILFLAGGIFSPLLLPLSFFLLEAATPITLDASQRLLPAMPATATGLTLGLGIGVGGIGLLIHNTLSLPNFLTLISCLLLISTILSYKGVSVACAQRSDKSL